MNTSSVPNKPNQRGAALLEALVAILIVSFGILALVGLQASAISAASDARYRSEASYLIDQLIGRMTVSVDRSTSTTLEDSVEAFQHQSTGATCSADAEFEGGESASPVVTDWVSAMTNAGTGLPGTKAEWIQIKVDTGASNQVEITVCWQPGNAKTSGEDQVVHRYTALAYIN